jgi:hypothetical protein
VVPQLDAHGGITEGTENTEGRGAYPSVSSLAQCFSDPNLPGLHPCPPAPASASSTHLAKQHQPVVSTIGDCPATGEDRTGRCVIRARSRQPVRLQRTWHSNISLWFQPSATARYPRPHRRGAPARAFRRGSTGTREIAVYCPQRLATLRVRPLAWQHPTNRLQATACWYHLY